MTLGAYPNVGEEASENAVVVALDQATVRRREPQAFHLLEELGTVEGRQRPSRIDEGLRRTISLRGLQLLVQGRDRAHGNMILSHPTYVVFFHPTFLYSKESYVAHRLRVFYGEFPGFIRVKSRGKFAVVRTGDLTEIFRLGDFGLDLL
jgi:hypothetical protein